MKNSHFLDFEDCCLLDCNPTYMVQFYCYNTD